MKKSDATAIVNKLAPSISTGLDRTLKLSQESGGELEYASHLGFVSLKNLDFQIEEGLYSIDQISKVFKLLKDSPGKLLSGGVRVNGIKVTLAKQTQEVPSFNAKFQATKEYNLESAGLLDLLQHSKQFMQKNNSVSRLIIDGGKAIAFDGSRVFKTTVIQCEAGSEEIDPQLKALEGLQFELKTEQIEPLVLFLTASDDLEVTIGVEENTVRFQHNEGVLILFTLPFGSMTSVATIEPLFDSGDYYTIPLHNLELTDKIRDILTLDDDKNTVIHFSAEQNSIYNDQQSIAIDIDDGVIQKPFQVSGKFLMQSLSVFDKEDEVTMKIYEQSVVMTTQYAKAALLMCVISR